MTIPPDEHARDVRLAALWRSASQDAPPANVDAAIRAAARREVQAGPNRPHARWRPPQHRAWWPLAAAATMAAITFGITQLTPPESDWSPISSGQRVDAPTARQVAAPPPGIDAPAGQVDGPPRGVDAPPRAVDAPTRSNEAPRDAKALARKADATPRAVDTPARKAAAFAREGDAPPRVEGRMQSAPAAVARPAPSSTAEATPLPDHPPPTFAAPASSVMAPQAVAPRPAPSGEVVAAAPPPAPMTRPDRQALANNAAALPEHSRVAAATTPAAGSPRVVVPGFDAWVKAIQQLLHHGRRDEARREATRLVDAYPNREQALPAEVRTLLPTR